MASNLPPQFIDLKSASIQTPGSFINVMGVVTESLGITRSKGTDMTCTFSLADRSYGNIGYIGDEGLKVRCFNQLATGLPPIQGKGDVVLLRNAKINQWQGMTHIITTHATKWAVIPSASIPVNPSTSFQPLQMVHNKSHGNLALSRLEMLYAIDLCNLNDREAYGEPPAENMKAASPPAKSTPQGGSRGKKGYGLIKDIEIECYYELIGQVVKTYTHSDRLELYITDYTSNQVLWNYPPPEEEHDWVRDGDDFGYLPRRQKPSWPGPFGKLTLTVTLWPPHSIWAQSHIKVDDFVSLRNVHVKFSKDSKMEGVMHPDQRYPDKIEVSVLRDYEDDDRVKDVLRRKRDYWKKHKKPETKPDSEEIQLDLGNPKTGLKRKAVDEGKPLSKGQKKRRKKAEAEAAAKAKSRTPAQDAAPTDNKPKTNGHTTTPSLAQTNPKLNPNIRCAHPSVPPRPLSAIKSLETHINTAPGGHTYTLPFQNINSRATVRVVGFYPPHLEDFTIRERRKHSEYACLSDEESASPSSPENDRDEEGHAEMDDDDDDNDREMNELHRSKWTWGFKLLLEDASKRKGQKASESERESERLWVTVAGQDAEYLLRLDAGDLHRGSQAVATLKERLFLLWGELEEEKRAARDKAGEADAAMGLEVDVEVEEAKIPPFQCCLKEYGVKVRKERGAEEGLDQASEAEDEGGLVTGERGYKREWFYERRWMMFGCTIL